MRWLFIWCFHNKWFTKATYFSIMKAAHINEKTELEEKNREQK